MGNMKQSMSRCMHNCEIHQKICRRFARCCFCCCYIVTDFAHIQQDYFSGITVVIIRWIAPARPISQIPHGLRKISYDAPFFKGNVHISVTKLCIVGQETGTLWDLLIVSIHKKKPLEGIQGKRMISLQQTKTKHTKLCAFLYDVFSHQMHLSFCY